MLGNYYQGFPDSFIFFLMNKPLMNYQTKTVK
jgi:hypothetical protein